MMDMYKLKTGFTGTPLFLLTLFDNGLDIDAYRFLFNQKFPGWLYAVNLGATTIWERWNSLLENGNIDKDEVRKSYEIAKILLIMNYHVLNSYYYSTNMKSQIERLIVDERGIRPSDFRREYRKTINDCKKEMTKYCKSVIRIFSLDWKIKF